MKVVFKEPELQSRFEKAVDMHESFRKAVSVEVNLSDATSILSSIETLINSLSTGATAKAMFDYLLAKNMAQKVIGIKDETLGANEKKALLTAEVGDIMFYDKLSEYLIREAHYKLDSLRSALSYLKSEVQNLN
jgi:glutamine synthetase type III